MKRPEVDKQENSALQNDVYIHKASLTSYMQVDLKDFHQNSRN